MAEPVSRPDRGRIFLFLLIPLTAASLPSVGFCALVAILGLHGLGAPSPIVVHLPPESIWDRLFVLEALIYAWLTRWNALTTVAATVFFAVTLLRRRWRAFIRFALIPYVLLLCADFTMRWHNAVP